MGAKENREKDKVKKSFLLLSQQVLLNYDEKKKGYTEIKSL